MVKQLHGNNWPFISFFFFFFAVLQPTHWHRERNHFKLLKHSGVSWGSKQIPAVIVSKSIPQHLQRHM